jgi:HEAT repeat protein
MDEDFRDLLAQLEDTDRPLPLDRLEELSDLDAERTEHLYGLLEGIPEARRQELIAELGRQADENIVLSFERINRHAINDVNPEIRRIAIRNLWECEDPLLIAPLLETLANDPVESVRAQAATALGMFIELGELDKIRSHLRRQVEQGLLDAWDHDPSQDVRRSSLESLGYSSRKEVPGIIQSAYRSSEESMLRSALLAMGRSANAVWEPQVTEQLHHPGPEIRRVSARAAGELELKQAVETLIELLDDVNDQVRDAAAWALGQLGGRRASAALSDLLESADDEELIGVLEDALDHLEFVDGTHDFLMIDFEEPEEPSL